MAEVVAGALLSGFLNVLFERMATREAMQFFQGKQTIPKLIKELEIRLISADALLNDAEERQLRDKNVKKWLEELKDVIYDADHLIDKINTEILRLKAEEDNQSGSTSTNKCLNCLPVRRRLFDKDVKGELEEILASLKLLLKQSTHLRLNKDTNKRSSSARSLAPLVEESDVYGRDVEKKSLIKLLLSDDVSRQITVIPIVGMGGIGKTTLAEVVYNDTNVQSHFDFKVWVTVSEEFDVPRLSKLILESITSKKCEFEDPHQILSELKRALRGKKFLFVHDDVWNEMSGLWDILKSSFKSGAHGSKIIVTTRSDIVAKQMGNVEAYHLDGISEGDCQALFNKHVFDNVDGDAHSDLKELGVAIVRKCKGLPLAVKSIAGLLLSMMSQEEWRRVLESDIWDLEFRDVNSTNILPALWLSYSFLPPHLKGCFAFLSIFPKDYEFGESDKKTIILMWMAEGLLQTQNSRRAEDVGEEYFSTLVSRSLFQQSSKRDTPKVLIMHDLIHDLALFVSGGLRKNTNKIRYLSMQNMMKLENSNETTFLRTLMIIAPQRYVMKLHRYGFFPPNPLVDQTVFKKVLSRGDCLRPLKEVLSRGGCLRTLFLSKSFIKELPDSIRCLKYLRYLDLSETAIEDLPNSICSLYNLQTLLLTNCERLRRLPTDMSHLINLRHLDINWAGLLKEMPPHMSNMKDLQMLSSYIASKNQGSRIKELGELLNLRGSFALRQLENVNSVEDALEAKMVRKKFLEELLYWWDPIQQTVDPGMETEVLNALEPHSAVKKVSVISFGGIQFPSWVGKQSFNNMIEVYLNGCKNCRSLPPFGQLPSLKALEINRLYAVESIGDEFCGNTSKPFPSLERLAISHMSSWEKWAFTGTKQEGVTVFPQLNYFNIDHCGKMKVALPDGYLPALESIYIFECETMKSVFPIENSSDSSHLTTVCVWECESLELFSATGLPSTLTQLEVWKCPRLMSNRLSWGLQRLSSIQTLNLMGDLEGYSFPEEGLLQSGLKEINISDCESLKGFNDKGFLNLTALSILTIRKCKQLQSLPAEGLPLSLKKLWIEGCPLLEEQCQREIGQYWPKIQHIPDIRVYEC